MSGKKAQERWKDPYGRVEVVLSAPFFHWMTGLPGGCQIMGVFYCGCWRDGKPYDEAKYLIALKAQGSPLVEELASKLVFS